MDVEGHEYKMLESLLEDGNIGLVDELMVEIHYTHPDMNWAYWQYNFPGHTISDANCLLMKLREADVVVHPWP